MLRGLNLVSINIVNYLEIIFYQISGTGVLPSAYNTHKGGYGHGGGYHDDHGGGYGHDDHGGYDDHGHGGYDDHGHGGGYDDHGHGGYDDHHGGYDDHHGGGYDDHHGGGYDDHHGGGYDDHHGGGYGHDDHGGGYGHDDHGHGGYHKKKRSSHIKRDFDIGSKRKKPPPMLTPDPYDNPTGEKYWMTGKYGGYKSKGYGGRKGGRYIGHKDGGRGNNKKGGHGGRPIKHRKRRIRRELGRDAAGTAAAEHAASCYLNGCYD